MDSFNFWAWMTGVPMFRFHTHVLGVQVCHRVCTVSLGLDGQV